MCGTEVIPGFPTGNWDWRNCRGSWESALAQQNPSFLQSVHAFLGLLAFTQSVPVLRPAPVTLVQLTVARPILGLSLVSSGNPPSSSCRPGAQFLCFPAACTEKQHFPTLSRPVSIYRSTIPVADCILQRCCNNSSH